MIEYHGLRLANPASLVPLSAYEADEIELVLRHFDGRDRVLVAGSGMGLVQAAVASVAGWTLGVEPQRALVELVRQNVSVAGTRVTVYHGALVAEKTGAMIQVSREPDEDWALARVRQEDGEWTPQLEVGALMDDEELNAVALDVEGAEAQLLPSILERADKTVVEVHNFALSLEEHRAVYAAFHVAGHEIVESLERDRVPVTIVRTQRR